jgi:hypothetical protein
MSRYYTLLELCVVDSMQKSAGMFSAGINAASAMHGVGKGIGSSRLGSLKSHLGSATEQKAMKVLNAGRKEHAARLSSSAPALGKPAGFNGYRGGVDGAQAAAGVWG